jgi:cyclopropane fatty-acyl-phospholipid synthase-like methyltransferase
MSKQVWPAPERNKAPILEVLRRVLPARGTLLEIGSGTGQHAVYFAEQLPGLVFQPSDVDPENLASIRAWVEDARLPNLRLPFRLDVLAPHWSIDKVSAIYSANMIHIAPWECAEALFTGAGRHLAEDGVCVLYGPFSIAGEHTAPSNGVPAAPEARHAGRHRLTRRYSFRQTGSQPSSGSMLPSSHSSPGASVLLPQTSQLIESS